MKKIISILIALSMIFAMATVLSSCDISDIIDKFGVSDSDETPDSGNTDNLPGDGNTDNLPGGDSNDEPKVRTTVTAEEWMAHVEATNYTANITLEIKQTDAAGMENVTTSTGYIKSAYPTILKKDVSTGRISYNTTVEDVKYRIDYENDKYMAYPDDTDVQFTIGMNKSFEELTYSEEKAAYLYVTEASGSETLIYFEDGVMTKAVATSTNSSGAEATMTIVFTDIGTTVVDLPEYEIYVPRATVTEEEWSYYKSLTNYTLTESGWMKGEMGTQTIPETQLDRKLMQADDSAYHVYTADGKNTEEFYKLKDGSWYKVVNNGIENVYQITSGYTEEHSYLAQLFKDEYIFDEEKGAYTYSERKYYNGTFGQFYIYFADGKLEKIEISVLVDTTIANSKYYMEGEITITLSDIGSTAVTLPEIRNTVTEEEFNSHYNIDNYTVNMTTNMEMTGPDISFSTSSQTIDKYTPDAFESMGVNTSAHELLVLRDGKWYAVEYDYASNQYVGTPENSFFYTTLGDQLECEFADLTYDAEKGAYYALLEKDGISADSWLYFEAGRFAKQTISFTVEDDDGTVTAMSMIIICSDIGSTEIYVPEFTVEEPARTTVTEEEWNAMSDMYNYSVYNYMYCGVYDSEGNLLNEQEVEKEQQITETAVYAYDYTDGSEVYAYLEDGVWYVIAGDSEPVKAEDQKTPLSAFVIVPDKNGDPISFDDLVYDEELGVYDAPDPVNVSSYNVPCYVSYTFEDGILTEMTLIGGGEVTANGVECFISLEAYFVFTDIGTTEAYDPFAE